MSGKGQVRPPEHDLDDIARGCYARARPLPPSMPGRNVLVTPGIRRLVPGATLNFFALKLSFISHLILGAILVSFFVFEANVGWQMLGELNIFARSMTAFSGT